MGKMGKEEIHTKKSKILKNKLIMLIILLALIFMTMYILTNQEIRANMVKGLETNMKNAEEISKDTEIFEDGSAKLTDDSAIVASAAVQDKVTGTGPFDENDEAGNDSSAENNIVRSFDKVTWKVEANMEVNNTGHGSEDAKIYSKFRGGSIYIEATLPEENKGLMEWSLEDMAWAKDSGKVSEDGLTFTAKYEMPENNVTVPGKQMLEIVLKLYGAGNNTQLNPKFKLWMQGNETNSENEGYEAIEIEDSGEKVKVSASGKFNIKMVRNGTLETKTKVDFNDGKGEVPGRMYGYGIILQLHNENKEKGLKGIEYPKGSINFDINLKLETVETIDGESITTDITDLATPQLWNYTIHTKSRGVDPTYGEIANRNMYFGASSTGYLDGMPYGIMRDEKPLGAVYNSGNINMQQEQGKIKVTIDNYEFNGQFPKYNDYYVSGSKIMYDENIGCFSTGYFQIFVPDNEATMDKDKIYYLTINDSNIKINTISDNTINEQVQNDDDNIKIRHNYIKPGTYSHSIYLYEDDLSFKNELNNGKQFKSKGQNLQARIFITTGASNDEKIKSVNKLVKFDGKGLEPILQSDGEKIHGEAGSNWKVWYVTKKDGTNWVSQEERNNANIEDLNIYDTLEDIPEGYICIGMYLESDVESFENGSRYVDIRFKIKDTADIGETYAIVQNSDYWLEKLDRTTQTITNPDATYPETVFSRHNENYIKTEYDENGEMVEGTHQSFAYGNSILVVGAESSIKISPLDSKTGEVKTEYDLGKNENEVTFKIEPKLEEMDENNPLGVKGATITIKDTLGKGLTYVPGSSNYGEPIEKIENIDGTTTLKFEKYNCNVGEEIEPLEFKAMIDLRTANGTKITNKVVIEPDREKIGLTMLEFRTASCEINVINLGSQRLYKETQTQIIESNGEIRYKVNYQTNTTTEEFQLLDVLPYNGDGRGSAYNGTYTLEKVNIKQEGPGGIIENSNLKLYTTTDIDARKISPKDEGIGVEEIWKEKEIGKEIGEPVTVIGIKGRVEENTTVEVEIIVKTNNNRPADIYENSATAQTSKETEVITTTNVETKVVKREIEGMIWYDTNENGIKDEDEKYANRIEVELKKADGSKAQDINGNEIGNILTNEEGKYVFANLPKGEYIVEIKTEDKYKVTKKNVGTNQEINSKFEEKGTEEKQSYIITNLNNIESPEIIEKNVNAGLVVRDSKIVVKYLEEDQTPQTDEDNKVLKEEKEIIGKKVGDNYDITPEKIENYITLRNSGNTSGVLDNEEVIVTYYYIYNKKDIEIEKHWVDNNNQAGKRPKSIKVVLKDGNKIIKEEILTTANKKEQEENIWTIKVENVDIYRENGEKIDYTVDEEENEGNLDSYIKTINGMQIINTFTQNAEKINIDITKKWEDNDNKAGKRPEEIVLILKKEVETEDGKKEYQEVTRQTINKIDNEGSNKNEWKYVFSNIPKYDENNNEIKYTIEEQGINFYETKITKTSNNSYEIINTFKVPEEKLDIEVTKEWNDNNNRAGKRPKEVTLKLEGNNEENTKTIKLTKENEVQGKENIWKGTIKDLPKYDENADEIKYELKEEPLNNIFYKEENTTINQQTKTVTNKFEVPNDKISIEVNKKWEDNNNQLGKRPEEVILFLTGNNQEYEITLNESNKKQDDENIWKGTIDNLPKYDINGEEINYILDERPIANEFYTKTGIEQENKTVTNRFEIPTESVQIPVTKIWDDNSNQKGERPESIVLQIKKKGTKEIIREQLVRGNKTTNEGWSYIFEVPKYDEDGNIVEYEIGEKDLENKFYPTEEVIIDQEKRIITNKYKVPDEKIEITVDKKWVDNGIQSQRRPEEIIIQIKGENGEEVARQKLSKANKVGEDNNVWQYTFTNLPRYNKQGNEIKYTVDELEVKPKDLYFYQKSVTEVSNKEDETKKQATITNTFTRPNDNIEITVNKKWEDQENIYGKRPSSINVQIKNNGIEIAKKEMTKDNELGENKNEWVYTFTNLPKYDVNGVEIKYTVDEEDLLGEAQIFYKKQIQGTTIINEMVKTPATVRIKYVDINNNKEIIDAVEKEGIVGEPYDVTEYKKEIAGYTLVKEPEDPTGIFEQGVQEKTYYYAKNTEVIVKYLEKDNTPNNDSDNTVLKTEKISGHEGKEYKTEKKEIEGYTCIETKGQVEGKMTREPQEVIYYYAPNTTVRVRYLEQDETPENNEDNIPLIKEDIIINGYIGKEYKTEEKKIEGYTFVNSTKNTEGKMTKEEIQVIYYYAKNTGVTVRYLEQDKTPDNDNDNKELGKEIIQGYEGKEYKTKAKEIENYVLVGNKGQIEGKMTKEGIEVIYYYAQKTRVRVQHIDKKTGNILKEEIKEGKVGDICKTEAQDIEGYILVQEPENKEVEMTKEEKIVKYYYAHISKGVIEKHIDQITGEILYQEEHKGKEGDKYNIETKDFDGYDIVKEKMPENASGEMTKEAIEVKYYYIKKASVRVEYKEEGTENKLSEATIIKGHENDKYQTTAKEIPGYVLTKTPQNAKGEMKVTKNEDGSYNTETIVEYYYLKEAILVEKHIDINSGEILKEETHKGKVGDSYEIKAKEIEGYELVTKDEEGNSKLPQNAKGEMTKEKIEVIYYYQKLSTVKVQYVDKATGEKIKEEIIKGHEGEKYETKAKEIDGYILVETPKNAKGEMAKEEIIVIYYYQRKAQVEVKYIDKDTGYEIEEKQIIEGYVGKDYLTEEKDIKYYDLASKEGQTQGTMTKDKITVIYYYEKEIFNLSIETLIDKVSVDGIWQIAQGQNDKMYQININRNKANKTEVEVTYKIKITNKGELAGRATKIGQSIPKGFIYRQEDNKIKWVQENGILVTDAIKEENIEPGQSKEIELVLRWAKGEENFGEKETLSSIIGTENLAGYKDAEQEDNISKTKMLITIATGLDSRDKMIMVSIQIVQIVILITIGLILIIKKVKKTNE